MATISTKVFSAVLIAVCVATLAPTGLAYDELSPEAAQSISTSALLFPFPQQPVNVIQCWASLVNISGCVNEVFNTIFKGQIVIPVPGSVCCDAVIKINQNCWPAMFPLNQFVPRLLRTVCSKAAAAIHRRPSEIV